MRVSKQSAPTAKPTKASARKYLRANAREVARSLSAFQESAALFSSDSPRLIDKYENKWVAAHGGAVVGVADTLELLLQKIRRKRVPVGETMIRHIDREQKTLIL